MAEFSKEYIEATGHQMLPDFSLVAMLEDIEPPKEFDTVAYKSVICEGIGCIAVGKLNDERGITEVLGMPEPDDDERFEWCPMEEVLTSIKR